MWIGLSDIEAEGSMIWSDDTVNDYNNWRPHQPDDGGNSEDCVHMYKQSTGSVWND